jgi:hypothetical protein
MPTNPLWLEHVERAAWDTVQTLRHELDRERRRVELLTKLQPALPKLLGEIELAAAELGITADEPRGVVAALRAKLAEPRPSPPAPAPAPVVVELDGRRKSRENLSVPVRWFARMLERQRRETGEDAERPDPAERDALVHRLQIRAAALATAGSRELFEFAVEIGCLALSLARIARRADDD